MTERHKSPIVEAVEQFLTASASSPGNPSLGASVSAELKLILRMVSRQLGEKAPDRLYTAAQIAGITKEVYHKKNEKPPEILRNMRAFGRFLQKYPKIVWFTVEGSMGNRRTYKPHDTGS